MEVRAPLPAWCSQPLTGPLPLHLHLLVSGRGASTHLCLAFGSISMRMVSLIECPVGYPEPVLAVR